MNIKVLIAEDDPDVGSLLCGYLQLNGFTAVLRPDGKAAWEELRQTSYDIAVIDVMMPLEDGFTLAGRIRQALPALPLIFLTARKLKEDVLKGLKLGADDYMTKPFDADELIQRMHNILRRVNGQQDQPQFLIIGRYVFEPQNLRLSSEDYARQLTDKEARLLAYLLEQQGRIVKRADALAALWENPDFFSGRSMDVFISRLRSYLAADPNIAIENIRGVGFRLNIGGSVQ
ncbi:response regulator transcription factor [Mucilaginibacter sp. CAU 1740]|uniref:response regulator transcription factor n=1 Tax=Mucilaginibacter sp. CAU 1740 TaxID=3140365 RepID=UPI00325A85EB